MPRRRALDAVEKSSGALLSRNIRIGSRRTSFRIDPLTWRLLQEIARRERVTVHELCAAVNSQKPPALSFTAAIRVAVLRYYHDAATENGHAKAGHGKTVH
jgi:predicted DNA-binding ribbon-helix-helix protein